jgi:hypothetical protein
VSVKRPLDGILRGDNKKDKSHRNEHWLQPAENLAVLYQTMRLRNLFLLAAALSPSVFTLAQTTQTLLATPTTVAWGYYDFHAKPVLTVHSGDTVIMQTASTCGPPERLTGQGVKTEDIPSLLADIYARFPRSSAARAAISSLARSP